MEHQQKTLDLLQEKIATTKRLVILARIKEKQEPKIIPDEHFNVRPEDNAMIYWNVQNANAKGWVTGFGLLD